MINLSTEPSLGSLILTRDGVSKYTYNLPVGMTFPDWAYGTLIFTDRAGGVYGSAYDGELDAAKTRITWVLDPDDVNEIPAGANFEVFVNLNGDDYKVRYGRVVRREASFPLNPIAAAAPALMYEDNLQREQVGPRWIEKHGKVALRDPSGPIGHAMAARNETTGLLSLWESAAVLWYAPTNSDSVELSVGLVAGGAGDCTIVLCSNYAMTSFVGVRFHTPAWLVAPNDEIQIVTGSSWDSLNQQGGGYDHVVPSGGQMYKIRYSLPLNKVSVFIGDATDPVIEWVDESGLAHHGAGYRYAGAIWNAQLLTTGPLLYYWKMRDVVL